MHQLLRGREFVLGIVGSGLLLLAPFLPWYAGDTEIRCVTTPCPASIAISGWEAFTSTDLIFESIALASLVCLTLAIAKHARLAAWAAQALGLAAVALAFYTIVEPPDLAPLGGKTPIGPAPFLALLGGALIVAAVWRESVAQR